MDPEPDNIIPLFEVESIPDTPNGPLYRAWKRIRDDEIAREWSLTHFAPIQTLEEVKQQHIARAVARCGTPERAAAALGVARSMIYSRGFRAGSGRGQP